MHQPRIQQLIDEPTTVVKVKDLYPCEGLKCRPSVIVYDYKLFFFYDDLYKGNLSLSVNMETSPCVTLCHQSLELEQSPCTSHISTVAHCFLAVS